MCCILFYILIALVVLIWIASFWFAYNSDKKSYNNDKKFYHNEICPCCGNKLKLYDINYQSGIGYICPKCGYTIWISYNGDKRE